MLACLCALAFSSAALASNRVPEMEIDVALRADGSAYITQIWTTDTDSGTEFYLACNDSGYLRISDFSVSDLDGAYDYVDEWDVDATFEEKARRCGMVETADGVELCWGVSEYGENRYAIEYVIENLVSAYSDADGFNHRFVDEMSFFPTDVVLTIRRADGVALTEDECAIWAFGYDGQIWLEDGVVRAWSDSPLENGQHMTVMLALKKGVLSPKRSVEDSFETVKQRALSGSDYERGDGAEEELTADDLVLIAVLFVGAAALIVGAVALFARLRKAAMKRRMQSVAYFRDAPNGGNLNVTYVLARACGLCRDDSLLGAYLLRLIVDGSLEPEGENDAPRQVNLRLVRAPQSENSYDDALYTVLEAAAGPDGVLGARELERYSSQNVQPLSRFMDSCLREGKQTLIQDGCLRGATCDNRRDLTAKGTQQLDEILGLKRFLLDFSLIAERDVRESVIWQDYMVYALLLGIADKVAPQIKKLYPDALPQIERVERCTHYVGYYNGLLYAAYQNDRFRNQSRSMGGGGFASFGGGGGFSGGGGGGVR